MEDLTFGHPTHGGIIKKPVEYVKPYDVTENLTTASPSDERGGVYVPTNVIPFNLEEQ
jgi:hypothetical protein